jgi:hypothetical protein
VIDDLNVGDFKYSYGFRFSYIVDEYVRLTGRTDYGFGKNTGSIYFPMQDEF